MDKPYSTLMSVFSFHVVLSRADYRFSSNILLDQYQHVSYSVSEADCYFTQYGASKQPYHLLRAVTGFSVVANVVDDSIKNYVIFVCNFFRIHASDRF
jgi:hypothetical protein